MEFGPVDADPLQPRQIKLGIIGSGQTTNGLRGWLTRCEGGLPKKNSRQPNLFPEFPGSGTSGPFKCHFDVEDTNVVAIPHSAISRVVGESNDDTAMRAALDLFTGEIESLSQRDNPPHVILCALPVEIIERVKNNRALGDAEDEEEERHDYEDVRVRDFRGALKARAMALRAPIQIIWPTTYDNSAVIKRKFAELSDRTVQDEATRAWNIFCALYYKGGGRPWRLVRDPKALATAFMGVSFYKSLDGTALLTSSAQLFDERGDGLVLRGGRAIEDKVDRHPYLSGDDAHALLAESLAAYRHEHHHFPARLVLHKSSRFHDEERGGFEQALGECGVDHADLIWLPRYCPIKLFRNGLYPPLRGTSIILDDDQAILYTRGSVDFFRTYPGQSVPRPLWLRIARRDSPSIDQLLSESLTLTKMNWNNTQFDGALPITMKAARQVGDILKYVPEGQTIDPRYRFYM